MQPPTLSLSTIFHINPKEELQQDTTPLYAEDLKKLFFQNLNESALWQLCNIYASVAPRKIIALTEELNCRLNPSNELTFLQILSSIICGNEKNLQLLYDQSCYAGIRATLPYLISLKNPLSLKKLIYHSHLFYQVLSQQAADESVLNFLINQFKASESHQNHILHKIAHINIDKALELLKERGQKIDPTQLIYHIFSGYLSIALKFIKYPPANPLFMKKIGEQLIDSEVLSFAALTRKNQLFKIFTQLDEHQLTGIPLSDQFLQKIEVQK